MIEIPIHYRPTMVPDGRAVILGPRVDPFGRKQREVMIVDLVARTTHGDRLSGLDGAELYVRDRAGAEVVQAMLHPHVRLSDAADEG